jgi:transposase-like protein
MALMELLRKAEMDQDVDFLREGVRTLSQALMELEVSQHLGAERHERTPERTGQRNGYRERQWDTRVGTIPLRVPRVRDGSYFPALLEPRRRAERALVAVIQEAYVQGVSTRRVDEVVQALGMQGISKSQVSRLCQELDAEVERFRLRRLTSPYPYVWLDATYVKVRQDGRVRSMAVVVAIGVTASGEREVLGLEVGPSEEGACLCAVSARPAGTGAERRATGHQRCPSGAESGHWGGAARGELATAQGAHHPNAIAHWADQRLIRSLPRQPAESHVESPTYHPLQ